MASEHVYKKIQLLGLLLKRHDESFPIKPDLTGKWFFYNPFNLFCLTVLITCLSSQTFQNITLIKIGLFYFSVYMINILLVRKLRL